MPGTVNDEVKHGEGCRQLVVVAPLRAVIETACESRRVLPNDVFSTANDTLQATTNISELSIARVNTRVHHDLHLSRWSEHKPARDISRVKCERLLRRGHKKPPPERGLAVRDTGFEPVTSSVSRKRATTAPIARISEEIAHVIVSKIANTAKDARRRPQSVVHRGDDGIRTRVDGFAGRCLASRPRHRVG